MLLKCGKAEVSDGVVSEIVKRRGETVIERIWKVCRNEWKSFHVPNDWMKAVIVSLFNVKGSKHAFKNWSSLQSWKGVCKDND